MKMSSCVSAVLISLACNKHLFPRQLTHKHSLHYITDDGKVLETMQRENLPWKDSIHIQFENTTTYSAKGYSKVHNVHETRNHQAFTRVQLFPMNRMGRATGNKP